MILKPQFYALLLSLTFYNTGVQAQESESNEVVAPISTLSKPAPPPPMSANDTYESFNRPVFEFNMQFNNAIGQPVATAYTDFVPQPARTGFSNFFSNLAVPLSSLNSFLQGDIEDGLTGVMRFTLNSTFGLFGLLDIATPAGLADKKEDFGQTLYHWGLWNETNYLVLPFVGPFTMRELAGGSIESVYDPVYHYFIDVDFRERSLIFLGEKFVDYTKVADLIMDLKNQPDPYIFARESYLQYRTNLIYNGKMPATALDDFDFD